MSKAICTVFVSIFCMGAFVTAANAFDPVAFGDLIQDENPATTYSPAKGPC